MTKNANSKQKMRYQFICLVERKLKLGANYRFQSLKFRILNLFGIWCLCFDIYF